MFMPTIPPKLVPTTGTESQPKKSKKATASAA